MSATPLIGDAFPRFSEADWRALAAASIGARSLDTLVSRSDDGIAVGPIYAASEAGTVPGRHGSAPWTVIQRIDARNADEAASLIRTAFGGGAGGVELVFDGSPIARGAGLATGLDRLDHALRDILQGGGCLRIDAGEATADVFSLLSADLRPDEAGSSATLGFSFDPAATLAARGWLERPLEASVDAALAAVGSLEARGVGGSAIIADGRPWHDGGASEAQELAATLSAVVAFLRQADRKGLDLDRLAPRIGIALAADTDQFLTMAKFRAARLLVARVLGLAGLPEGPCHVHGETAWRMMSRRDPHMNMLRATTATFAAAVGGADSITVLPFASGGDDAFARRMAQDTQLILIEEAHLARVADPGAGAGAVEALTAALAEAAWDLFRGIEAEGGLFAAVRSGSVQRAVAAKRDERLGRVAAREIELVGINVFTNDALPADFGDIRTAAGPPRPAAPAEEAEPLKAVRLAEPFEAGGA